MVVSANGGTEDGSTAVPSSSRLPALLNNHSMALSRFPSYAPVLAFRVSSSATRENVRFPRGLWYPAPG